MKNFSFNGITKDYIRALKGSNRPSWAPITRGYQEVPNRAGAHLIKKRKTSPRPLPVPVYFKGDSVADLQKLKENLAAWLIHDDPKPLIFDDEPDRTYYAIVDGSFDPEEFVSVGQGVIPFICPDPYKYGAENIMTLSNNVSVINSGTVETSPIITVMFTSPSNGFTMTHTQSGNYVGIFFNFVAGDKLEIDLSKRKFRINNIVNMAVYDWESRPFDLLPSANSFTFAPSTGVNVTIKYRPKFL